mgnify:CR=1 FL=1
MTLLKTEDLWTDRRLQCAHASMQETLSSKNNTSYDSCLFMGIRNAFRVFDPLFVLMNTTTNWYIDENTQEDIMLGRTKLSKDFVRVRHIIEVPSNDTGSAFVQPNFLFPILIQGSTVETTEGDYFETKINIRVPSVFSKKYDTVYNIRQRLFSGPPREECIYILLEDVDALDKQKNVFGTHLIRVERSAMDETCVTLLFDTRDNPFWLPAYAKNFAFQFLYLKLKTMCVDFCRDVTEFHMRDAKKKFLIQEMQRATLLHSWVSKNLYSDDCTTHGS